MQDVSVEEATRIVDSVVKPVRPRLMPLAHALGLRVAEDVHAKVCFPMDRRADIDGFAVTEGVSAAFKSGSPLIVPTTAESIDLGQLLGPEVQAIVPFDAVRKRKNQRFASSPIRPGENIREPGALARAGELLISAGKALSLNATLVLEMCGVSNILVRQPVVDVFFNSSHVRHDGESFIRIVASTISRSSGALGSIEFINGNGAALTSALMASSADVLCVVGGIGPGPSDTTVAAVMEAGKLHFHGVRLDPGGLAGLGEVSGKPVLMLPGELTNMIAANATLTRLVALKSLNQPLRTPLMHKAVLKAALAAPGSRARLHFGNLDGDDLEIFAGSRLRWPDLARANAMVVMPERSRSRRIGEKVDVVRLPFVA